MLLLQTLCSGERTREKERERHVFLLFHFVLELRSREFREKKGTEKKRKKKIIRSVMWLENISLSRLWRYGFYIWFDSHDVKLILGIRIRMPDLYSQKEEGTKCVIGDGSVYRWRHKRSNKTIATTRICFVRIADYLYLVLLLACLANRLYIDRKRGNNRRDIVLDYKGNDGFVFYWWFSR